MLRGWRICGLRRSKSLKHEVGGGGIVFPIIVSANGHPIAVINRYFWIRQSAVYSGIAQRGSDRQRTKLALFRAPTMNPAIRISSPWPTKPRVLMLPRSELELRERSYASTNAIPVWSSALLTTTVYAPAPSDQTGRLVGVARCEPIRLHRRGGGVVRPIVIGCDNRAARVIESQNRIRQRATYALIGEEGPIARRTMFLLRSR